MIVLPDEHYRSAKASAQISFYCTYGHQQHFAQGETEAEKLRRERDRLKQQAAFKDEMIANANRRALNAERTASARKGQITPLKNRAAAGVCPCCNRTFENIRRHMASKHPAFQVEAAE